MFARGITYIWKLLKLDTLACIRRDSLGNALTGGLMKIFQKLWLIAALMMVSLTALTVFAHFKAQRVSSEVHDVAAQTESALLITSTSNEINNLLLVAMDVIVDKEAGKADGALVAEAENSAAVIKKNLESIAKTDAQNAPQYEEINAIVAKIHTTMKERLYPAVAEGAAPDLFAELDDTIDSTGSEAKSEVIDNS